MGDSTTSTGNRTFPIAAIAVISIVGGLIAIFAAYKIYVCSYRRSSKRDNQTSNPYPEARPLASQANLVGGAGLNTTGSRMSMAFGNGTGEGGFGSVWHAGKRTSSMGFGANEMWSQGGYSNDKSGSYGVNEKDAVYDEMNHSRSATPISPGNTVSRESSPYGRRESQSELGMMGVGERRSSMGTMPSRNSMVGNARRSMYGPTALSNGPQIRSMNSSNRLSGAPHGLHSRIDIVPPLRKYSNFPNVSGKGDAYDSTFFAQLSVLPRATLLLLIRLLYSSQLYRVLVEEDYPPMTGSSTVPEIESRIKSPLAEIPTSTEITLPAQGTEILAQTRIAPLTRSLLLPPIPEVEIPEFPLPIPTTIRTNSLLPLSTLIPPAPIHPPLLPLACHFLTILRSRTRL